MFKGEIRQIVLPLLAFLLGVTVIIGGWNLSANFSYDGLGSRVLPIGVGIGLCVSSLVVALSAYRNLGNLDIESIDFWPPLLIAGGLLFMYFFVWSLGWIVSATVLFVAVSKAFKEKRNVATVGIALAMSTLTYFTFTFLLGVRLPAGKLFGQLF